MVFEGGLARVFGLMVFLGCLFKNIQYIICSRGFAWFVWKMYRSRGLMETVAELDNGRLFFLHLKVRFGLCNIKKQVEKDQCIIKKKQRWFLMLNMDKSLTRSH